MDLTCIQAANFQCRQNIALQHHQWGSLNFFLFKLPQAVIALEQPSPGNLQLAVDHGLPPQRQDDQETKPGAADLGTTDPQWALQQQTTIGYMADQHTVSQESVVRGRFGDYETTSELGHGGMGIVYKARQAGTGCLIQLKLIPPDYLRNLLPAVRENALARFRNEVQATDLLEHDHIVTVNDIREIR